MMKKITLLFIFLASYIGYAQPTTNAPTPIKAAANVLSIYSDVYTNLATNYNPGWGQSGTVNTTYDPTGGATNYVMAYTNFNYQGTDVSATNASAMEFLHIDIWTAASPGASIIQVSPISTGGGTSETLVTINHTAGAWTSVDIPKSSFTGMTWANVVQLKFAANGAGSAVPIDIYLDNIYFWKAPIDPLKDATLSDLKVDGTTINSFSAATINYTYSVPTGTTVVPQISSVTTTNGSATYVINQASAIPGSATVVVTSADASTQKTYTVSIVAVGPGTAANTPPTRAVADVKSLYSGAYTNSVSDGGPVTFAGATVVEGPIATNNTLKLTVPNSGGGFQYGYFGNPSLDLTNFTNFHVDFFIDGSVSAGQQFQIILQNFTSGGAFEHNIIYNFDVNALGAGSWKSGDVLLSAFTNSGLSRSNIKQVQVVCAGPSTFGPVYIDNIYFHKNTTLSNSKFDISNFSVYPNPSKSSWIIKTSNINMSAIKVYDILGKNVLTLTPNASEASINGSSLKAGLYFAQIKTANGVSSIKLVKE